MGEHLLSPLHIQKLGHPIEEIRLRALSSVISKYNLNLVNECNLENTKLLFEKLLNWFDFEKFTEEEKVLKLFIKALKYKNADSILKELDRKKLFKRVKEIEKKISYEYSYLIQEIISCISKIDKNDGRLELEIVNDNFVNVDYFKEKNTEIFNDEEKNYICFPTQSKHSESSSEKEECINNSIYKVEYFPWQHLIPGDKHILSSVYDGLRYIDNKNSILQSCQFFNEVLLRDFPTEVFLQRPLIIKTFLRLLECTESDVRIHILNSLKKVVQHLKESIKFVINTSVFHRKKEYYTATAFPNKSDDNSESSVFFENFHLNLESLEEDLQYDDFDVDPNIKRYQMSVPEFCFETCFQILFLLKKNQSLEEVTALLDMSFEILQCLLFNIKSSIWSNSDVRNKFSKIFEKLNELLKFYKGKYQVFVILLYITINLLNSLKPPSSVELNEIFVGGLQSEFRSCISNFTLVLLFPQLHSEILKYVEQLLGRREKEAILDHKETLIILESMKSALMFLKSCNKLKTKFEKLECADSVLASLDFHQDVRFIKLFLSSCLTKWRKCQLKEEELKLRQKVLIKLLAHCNDFVKRSTYMEIKRISEELLGVEAAKNPKFDYPGEKMDFLFDTDILTEILCHGLSSSLPEVQKCSSDVIMYLLKSKYLMSEESWTDFINALIPCLPLLQCYADKFTSLGRCIVKLFDPDIAKSVCLPSIEILKGNIRFLYSKNSLTREEAISRLFWLLSKEDSGKTKLPRMSVLTGLNLSGICSSVKAQDFFKIRQSFYSPERLCDVLEMLGAENVEPSLKRSALSQIAVMMDDTHLHPTYLEQKGLDKILGILENCLIEKEYRNYPDSVIPIIDILKSLALHNPSVRQELSCQINVLYNVLRGLFLFSSDDKLRQNAVELLCLLLYCEYILRVPSELSVECALSLPAVVVNNMCLPFKSHVHWKNSRHFEPSVKKGLMRKENCSQLIRTYWTMQWVGSLPKLMAISNTELEEKAYPPGIPDDMKLSHEDLESLRSCAFGVSVKQNLYNIQNATTHDAVFTSLHNLHCYFLLYNIDKSTNCKKSSEISSDASLSHMLWESTLERFLTSKPSCNQDEILLLKIVRFVQILLKSFKSERLIDWLEKLLVDPHQPLPNLLKTIGTDEMGLAGKTLRLSVIELAQEVVTLKSALDRNKWFYYIELVSDHLKLDRTHEFYNVAFVDWLLSFLTHLTGKWSWDFEGKTRCLEKLIIRITEIVIAFHCTKDSVVSFMGVNILRNSLLALNQILGATQSNLKEWEKFWHETLRKVVGQKNNPNYCWLLSMWFMRDPVTRAAAYQLFVGFSLTPISSDLLIDQMNIQFEHIWNHGFQVLFDSKECNLVREKVTLLLSNLSLHGTKINCGSFFEHLQSMNFYQEVFKIISNYHSELTLACVTVHETLFSFLGEAITAPSFVTSVCKFLMSLMSIKPLEVAKQMLDSGIIESLTRLLGEIPESANICEKHNQSTDVLYMYINICKLLVRSILSDSSVHSVVLQSQQFVSNLLSMINCNLYCEKSRAVTVLKHELWSAILDLFSAILANGTKCESVGFLLLNRSLTENGIDHFISSLYVAITSDAMNLRCSVFHFLINLFHHEKNSPSNVSICDIFDRKISDRALKATISRGWKPLKISETLTLNFGVRLADVLYQVFLLSTSCCVQACKMTVVKSFGSLLAVCKSAQNFCVDQGSPDSIVSLMKQICAKLSLESVDSLKKLSIKKKISPLLWDLESLFQVITNLMYDNEKAKTAVADCALSGVVHKLWPWCIAQQSLFEVTLKMLCTFTHSSNHACRTLVLSGGLGVLGLKKSPGSLTLINSIMSQVTSEMDLISYDRDFKILCLCLQLLSNSCRVAECRSVISKGNFMQCFTKLHPTKRRKAYGDAVIESWLKFLKALTAYQEGQLNICKSEEVLDILIIMATSAKSNHRLDALNILRNICLLQLNKVRMLGCCSFLALLFSTLDSKRSGEVQVVAVMIWALSCNSQKAKLILRSSGFESKLISTKRKFVLNEDLETAQLIDSVLEILKNK